MRPILNQRHQARLPAISLLVLALASGVTWRAELELRGGWQGLKWIGYFHWAVPVCVFAFIVWVVCVARVRRPCMFTAALVGFAVAGYRGVDVIFLHFFGGWLPGMFVMGLRDNFGPEVVSWIYLSGFAVLWSLIPPAFCLLCRAFGVPVTIGHALSSAVLFTVSWPVAIVVREFFEQRGSPDLIHALKSGFVIPFLVFSLGLPLLCTVVARQREVAPSFSKPYPPDP